MTKFINLQNYIFNVEQIKLIENRGKSIVVTLIGAQFPEFIEYKSAQEATDAFARTWAELNKEGE
jgi:hypothetical protein